MGWKFYLCDETKNRSIMTEHQTSPTSKRYVKLTKENAYPLIERYFASGDLPSTFYRREGLTEHQFYKWRKHYLSDHPSLASELGLAVGARRSRHGCRRKGTGKASGVRGSSSGIGFGRLVASGVHPSSGVSPQERWEIEYPNGVILRIGSSTSAEVVGALVSVSGSFVITG